MATHQSQLHISFRDDTWLERFPLTDQSALDYFSLSGFYERTCNNEVCKMQQLEPSRMETMQGIEYVLVATENPNPSIFVVREQERFVGKVVKRRLFYILNGTIYQCPNLYSSFSSRLVRLE